MVRASTWMLGIGLATMLAMCLSIFTTYSELGTCSMSVCVPAFYEIPIDSPYSLLAGRYKTFLYREGGVSRHYDGPASLGGVPVIFIPGNAGSHSQGRSMASLAATMSKEADSDTIFDWFMIDLDEDLSALHGKTLLDQAQYVNDVIFHLLKMYISVPNPKRLPPSSVIIVSHSMGGMVARTLVTLDNFVPGSVKIMYALSAPNIVPPITFDRDITEVYDSVNQYWRNTFDKSMDQGFKEAELNALHDLTLVSISGGHTDFMVPPDYTPVQSIMPETHGISAFTYSIPGVWRGVDHLAIVWCDELRRVIINSMFAIVDPTHPHRAIKLNERMQALESLYQSPIDNLPVNSSLVWHGSNEEPVQGSFSTPIGPMSVYDSSREAVPEGSMPVTYSNGGNVSLLRLLLTGITVPLNDRFVDIDMPAVQSSLISLRVRVARGCKLPNPSNGKLSELPIAIRHWTPRESRWYEGNDVRVFWYSSAPFIPFPQNTFSSLHVQIMSPELCEQGPSHYAHIRIDPWATMASISFRYRTAAVSYTFAVMIASLLIQLHQFYNGRFVSFGKSLEIFVSKYLSILCVIVALLHMLLTITSVRNLVRMLQLPTEWRNIQGLKASDISFDVNEILAGLNDPSLFCVPVFLVLMGTAITLLVDRLLTLIIAVKVAAVDLVKYLWNMVHQEASESKERFKSDGEMSPPATPSKPALPSPIRLSTNLLGLVILFFIPYQVAFVAVSVYLLIRVNTTSAWAYTFLIIFLWTSIVDAPMIAVWGRNVSFEWAFAFSSISNVLAVAPTVLLVHIMGQRPNPIPPLWVRPSLRICTYGLLAYMAYYSLMHGIMHSFMIHHLVNYMCAWMTILYLESARSDQKLN